MYIYLVEDSCYIQIRTISSQIESQNDQYIFLRTFSLGFQVVFMEIDDRNYSKVLNLVLRQNFLFAEIKSI